MGKDAAPARRSGSTMEIRLHGRGGQGAVTCAKILAAVFARLQKSVQTFGDYAGERSGAPVRAYTRVSDQPITNRNKVYHPDHLLVLDPTLLGDNTLAGLTPGGTLLLNAAEPLESFAERYQAFRLAVVDASGIARQHRIGSRTVVIVNTTIAGAFMRAFGIPMEILEGVYRDLGFLSNLPAAREAYEALQVREAGGPEILAAEITAPRPVVEALADHRSSPPLGLQTGAWRSQKPVRGEYLAPCNAWCPAGNDVVGFIQAVARNGVAEAARILGRSTPFAAVCGRVCAAPCMEGCNRREYDGAVNIRGLERWVADQVPVVQVERTSSEKPRRVAIVGGGPAGLAAAYTLALGGHAPTIFEAEAELGGVLRTGIPTYRLPRDVLDHEVEAILRLGVKARLGQALDPASLQELASQWDAVILATGLQRWRALKVPGADLAGIEQGLRFLHQVNCGGGVHLSGKVVVLGGGNTAMDCARSALRSGAAKVVVAYRRTEREMPAIREEIEEAWREGIEIRHRRQPVGFQGSKRVAAVVLAEVEMGEPDETGRRRPLPTERTELLECDTVLLALGQSPDLSLLPPGWELREGRVWQGGRPLTVFAAGDLATGDGTVTHAIGSGRRIAGQALQALAVETEVFERPDRTLAVPVSDIRLDHFQRREAAQEIREPVAARIADFGEVNLGLPDALEAHRCFSCGHCTSCDTCLVYCPEGIISRADPGYALDYSYCKGCGICAAECPHHAMEMS